MKQERTPPPGLDCPSSPQSIDPFGIVLINAGDSLDSPVSHLHYSKVTESYHPSPNPIRRKTHHQKQIPPLSGPAFARSSPSSLPLTNLDSTCSFVNLRQPPLNLVFLFILLVFAPLRPVASTVVAMSADQPLPFIYQFAAGAIAGVSEVCSSEFCPVGSRC
jgi:hypothetical protein